MEFVELVARHDPELAEALYRIFQEIQWAATEARRDSR